MSNDNMFVVEKYEKYLLFLAGRILSGAMRENAKEDGIKALTIVMLNKLRCHAHF